MKKIRLLSIFLAVILLALAILACGPDVSPTPTANWGVYTLPAELVFSPDTLPDAQMGDEYNVEIQISENRTPVFDFGISEGTLPKGLTFEFSQNENNKARIYGIPEEAGTFKFKLFASCYGTNVSGQTGEREYTIVVK